MLHLDCKKCYQCFVQIATTFPSVYLLATLAGRGAFANRLISARNVSKANAELACKTVRDLLSAYVDEWLRTGIQEDGGEEPANRRVQETKTAYAVARAYCDKNPATVMPHNGGLDVFFGFFGWELDDSPLGENNRESLIDDARNEAALIFTLLIDAPWRDRVYKCARCGKYGVLRRKPRQYYKRGIHCEKCATAASAVASRRGSLSDLQERRAKVATAAWRAWKPENGDRKRWVLAKVNDARENSDDFIKINWVTRWTKQYLTEIEKKGANNEPVQAG